MKLGEKDPATGTRFVFADETRENGDPIELGWIREITEETRKQHLPCARCGDLPRSALHHPESRKKQKDGSQILPKAHEYEERFPKSSVGKVFAKHHHVEGEYRHTGDAILDSVDEAIAWVAEDRKNAVVKFAEMREADRRRQTVVCPNCKTHLELAPNPATGRYPLHTDDGYITATERKAQP